ncbi:MAG: histidinol-phosphate transaminase [Lautropia sp.]|nr:histidinol-phosphate transaminase [Lautropia sp.]
MPSAKALVERCVRPDVQRMSAYVVQDPAGGIKLDAMENPYGFPESLRAELGRRLAAQAINRYPAAFTYERLKQAIRAHDGLGADQPVVLGNGSDELIAMLCTAMAQPGAVVMAPAPSFVMYQVSAQLNGLSFVPVPLKADFSLDREAMLHAIQLHRPSLVFLAYPNNPTGNRFDRADVESILRATDGLVVLDEAYAPFAGGAGWMAELADWPNLAVMRTCSKWGLAGARIGYMVAAHAWADQLEKIRPPYNISVLDAETAVFALGHWPKFQAQTDAIRQQREQLRAGLQPLCGPDGLAEVFASDANFVLVRVAASPQGGGRSARIAAQMREAGVLIKDVGRMHPLLVDCLRLTVGTPDENQAMLAALEAALEAVPAVSTMA